MNSSGKKVLLYIITKSELGGAQRNVYDLISNFQKDYEVHLATAINGQLTEKAIALGVRVHLIPNLTRSINLFSDFLAVKQCISLINIIKPDIIHAHSSKAGVVARLAGAICRIPTVFTAHGWGFTPGTPKLRRNIALVSEKLLATLATKIICVCESDHQLALKFGVGTQKSLVTIYNGVSDISVPIINASLQSPRLIMVARLNEQKDQTTLLKSIAKLKKLDFHLDFVGSGTSMEECKGLAQSLEITNKVSFLGDRTDVPSLLAQSQIFILSTHYEGFPISILEAMRAGLPVVATRVNGIPEQIENEKTGLLVPHEDVEALSNALSKLIDSPQMRQQMGEAGRQKFVQEFIVERMVTEVQAVYKEILDNRINKS